VPTVVDLRLLTTKPRAGTPVARGILGNRQMHELEKLVRRAGGQCVGRGRHIRYLLDGERITLKATTRPCHQHVCSIKAQIRRILRRRRGGQS
jgi:hypothetical protein